MKCGVAVQSRRTYHRVHGEPRSAKRNDDEEQQIFDGGRHDGRPRSAVDVLSAVGL